MSHSHFQTGHLPLDLPDFDFLNIHYESHSEQEQDYLQSSIDKSNTEQKQENLHPASSRSQITSTHIADNPASPQQTSSYGLARPPPAHSPEFKRKPLPIASAFLSSQEDSHIPNMSAHTSEEPTRTATTPPPDFGLTSKEQPLPQLPHHQTHTHFSRPAPRHSTQTPLSTSRTASISTSDNNHTTSLDTTTPIIMDHHTIDPTLNPNSISSAPPTTTPWKPGRTEYLIMLTLALSSLTVALDSTILIASLPFLASHLHASTTSAFWAGSAYLLPYAVVQPFLAMLSDIFGRRPLLVLSLGLFFLGSVPCAVADEMSVLLVGRVLQGVGGGGVVALSQAVYTDIVPLRLRPKYFSIVLLAWAVGTMLGPVVGGLLTDMAEEGWRWMFWLNLPIAGVAVVLSWVLVKLKPAGSKLTLGQKLAKVDCVGGTLMIGGLTSVLVAVSWGGNQYAWSSWRTLTPLLVGVAALVAFVVWEKRFAKYPFVKASVFPSVSAAVLFILSFLYGLTLFMALYYVCFYFSAVRLESPTDAGTNMIAALACTLPTSIVCGVLMTKLGRFRWAVWGGHAIETVGYGLLVLLDETTPTVEWAVILSIVGIGSGMSLSSLNFGVQTTTKTDRDSAAATVMYTFLRSTGMCVGVSIGSAIFQNVAATALADRDVSTEIARDAEAYVLETLRFLQPGDQLRDDVLASFVTGLRAVFIVMTAIKGASFAMSLAVTRRSMDRDLDGRFKVEEEKTSV